MALSLFKIVLLLLVTGSLEEWVAVDSTPPYYHVSTGTYTYCDAMTYCENMQTQLSHVDITDYMFLTKLHPVIKPKAGENFIIWIFNSGIQCPTATTNATVISYIGAIVHMTPSKVTTEQHLALCDSPFIPTTTTTTTTPATTSTTTTTPTTTSTTPTTTSTTTTTPLTTSTTPTTTSTTTTTPLTTSTTPTTTSTTTTTPTKTSTTPTTTSTTPTTTSTTSTKSTTTATTPTTTSTTPARTTTTLTTASTTTKTTSTTPTLTLTPITTSSTTTMLTTTSNTAPITTSSSQTESAPTTLSSGQPGVSSSPALSTPSPSTSASSTASTSESTSASSSPSSGTTSGTSSASSSPQSPSTSTAPTGGFQASTQHTLPQSPPNTTATLIQTGMKNQIAVSESNEPLWLQTGDHEYFINYECVKNKCPVSCSRAKQGDGKSFCESFIELFQVLPAPPNRVGKDFWIGGRASNIEILHDETIKFENYNQRPVKYQLSQHEVQELWQELRKQRRSRRMPSTKP